MGPSCRYYLRSYGPEPIPVAFYHTSSTTVSSADIYNRWLRKREKSIRVLYTCTLVAFHNSIFINYAKLNAFKLHNARWCGVSIDLNRCFDAPSRCIRTPFPTYAASLRPVSLDRRSGQYRCLYTYPTCNGLLRYDRDNNFYPIIENSGFSFVRTATVYPMQTHYPSVPFCSVPFRSSVRPSVRPYEGCAQRVTRGSRASAHARGTRCAFTHVGYTRSYDRNRIYNRARRREFVQWQC